MNDQYVRNVIEAALLAAGRPLASDELVTLFDERDGSNAEEVRTAIDALRSEYETRGLELVEVASGYRIQIRASVAQPVSRLWQERPTKYSRALLETLAPKTLRPRDPTRRRTMKNWMRRPSSTVPAVWSRAVPTTNSSDAAAHAPERTGAPGCAEGTAAARAGSKIALRRRRRIAPR